MQLRQERWAKAEREGRLLTCPCGRKYIKAPGQGIYCSTMCAATLAK